MLDQSLQLHFPNIGILGNSFSDVELEPLWKEVNSILDNNNASFVNHFHAGNVKKEFAIIDCLSYLESKIIPLTDEFKSTFPTFNYRDLTANQKLKITKCWVNFQEKTEFMSAHFHDGILSFVIWLQVPFMMADELNHNASSEKSSMTGPSFNIHYTDVFGQVQLNIMPVDNSWEGRMIMFPSRMSHSVHPFYTTNEYRICIAGNLDYDIAT